MTNLHPATRIDALLLAMEQVVLDYLTQRGGKVSRTEIVAALGLRQPTYPAMGPRAGVEKSWVAQTLLTRLELRGRVTLSKVKGRTTVQLSD